MNINNPDINNNSNGDLNFKLQGPYSPPIPLPNRPSRHSPKPLPKSPRLKKTTVHNPKEDDLEDYLHATHIEDDEVHPLLQNHKIHKAKTSQTTKPIFNFDHIEGRWEDEYGNKAKEDIIRLKTVHLLKEATLKELEYLKSKIAYSKFLPVKPTNEAVNALYAARIQELTRHLYEYDQMPIDWASSSYFRDILRGNPRLKFEYNSLVKKYLPLPVNMRMHTCEVFNNKTKIKEKSDLLRLGVISDMRNGFTNLKELKQLEQELTHGQTYNLYKLKNDILQKAEQQMKKGHYNVFGSANYALNEIKDLDSLKAAIKHRRQFLIAQTLPLILEHAKKTDLVKIDLLKILDVRILNHKTQTIDSKTGWYHHEANELLDMAEIFKELSDKSLICDGQGPFIDEDGDIHLPQLVKTPKGEFKKIGLFAAVVNHSVQGHTKNDGASHEVNLESYSRLVMKFPKQSHMEIAKILMKKRTGYASAIDLLDVAHRKGFKISTGCLSAKDRTGFVCAAWVVLKKMDCFSEKYKRNIIRKQLDSKFPAVKVIIDNTGTKRMKLRPFFLPGVTDDFAGILFRIVSFASQILEVLKEHGRIYLQIKEAQRESTQQQKAKNLTTEEYNHMTSIDQAYINAVDPEGV